MWILYRNQSSVRMHHKKRLNELWSELSTTMYHFVIYLHCCCGTKTKNTHHRHHRKLVRLWFCQANAIFDTREHWDFLISIEMKRNKIGFLFAVCLFMCRHRGDAIDSPIHDALIKKFPHRERCECNHMCMCLIMASNIWCAWNVPSLSSAHTPTGRHRSCSIFTFLFALVSLVYKLGFFFKFKRWAHRREPNH